MSSDFEAILETIRRRQWSLADIDWDAPGAETMSDELRKRLRPFMADLVWIEHLGARGFSSLAAKAPTPVLRDIYRYFQAEEQKHANAELALMKRWGMLEPGETMPEPNINVRMALNALDAYGDTFPFGGMSAVIALLECALDGALVKFLLDEVEDPLCQEVFRHINEDESRHLAVDFQVLEAIGARRRHRKVFKLLGAWQPQTLLTLVLVFIPLINKMRDNLVAMGMSEEQLHRAVQRFITVGSRSRDTQRNPAYRFMRSYARMVVDRAHPYHRILADPMVKLTSYIPRRVVGQPPTWTGDLTYEAVAS